MLALLSATFADPARTALTELGRIDAAVAALTDETDTVRVARIGLTCMFVDRLSGCRSALWRMLRDGRNGGAVTLSLHALSLLGLDHFMTGEWDVMQAFADEHVGLCRAHNYRLLECLGLYMQAMLAAARGGDVTATMLTDQMTRWAIPRRAGMILRLAAQARTLSALTRGDFEAAYQSATAITRPGELADHVPHALRMTLDLTEAAVRTGRACRSRGLRWVMPFASSFVGVTVEPVRSEICRKDGEGRHRIPVIRHYRGSHLLLGSVLERGAEVIDDAELSKDDRAFGVAVKALDLAVDQFEDVTARCVHLLAGRP